MNIGYARVSTTDQNTQLQIDALHLAGCERIYEEKISGAKENRPELNNCLKSLRNEDTLIVWKLDRLGRSQQHLVKIINDLESKKIGFKSLTESIDTTNATGKLVFHIFASLAEFEKDITKERIRAGLNVAKKNGKKFGRPQSLSEKEKELAINMHQGGATKIDISRHFNVTRQTIYKFLNKKG